MEFDTDTNRCFDCDGKLRHFAGCPWYTGEPVLNLEQRVAVQSLIAR
jgi:hypothetical protein